MGATNDTRLVIVGAGRLGSALSEAFGAAGVKVTGPLGRGATIPPVDAVLLCVPDREIANAAAAVPPGLMVGHCAGALGLGVVAPHEAFSFHPLLAMGMEHPAFAGAACAVAGSTERARGLATALADRLGMEPIAVDDEARDAYHAAASLASNYLVTLEDAAERLGRAAGMERRHLIPLARAALDAWAARGGVESLTGPIVRGDADTVRRQRAAVVREAPELLALWDAMAERTRALAARR